MDVSVPDGGIDVDPLGVRIVRLNENARRATTTSAPAIKTAGEMLEEGLGGWGAFAMLLL